jgi:uroporphyrinogen III methyltransferase/synthase
MPLHGKTILLTRPKEQAGGMIDEIERRGGRAEVFPAIRIVPPDSWDACDVALARIDTYDCFAFGSANAVRFFFDRMIVHGLDPVRLAGREVYAVGPATARSLEKRGLAVAFTPARPESEALVEGLRHRPLFGKRMLIPRGDLARDILPDGMRDLGVLVDGVVVYQTVAPEEGELEALKEKLRLGRVDAIVFASPSAVRNVWSRCSREEVEDITRRVVVAAIGPVTADALRALGVRVGVMGGESGGESVVEGLDTVLG